MRVMFVDNSGIVGPTDGLGWLKGVGVDVAKGCVPTVVLGPDVGVCFKTNQVHVPGSKPVLFWVFGAA